MTQEATATRICLTSGSTQRGYCGRKSTTATTELASVTCRECGAAIRADQHAGVLSPELAATHPC
jgi:hypothetical protein